MASDLDTLKTARTSLISAIATAEANPKPDYSIGGQSVSWTAYITSMYDRLDKLEARIAQLEPFNVDVEGWSA